MLVVAENPFLRLPFQLELWKRNFARRSHSSRLSLRKFFGNFLNLDRKLLIKRLPWTGISLLFHLLFAALFALYQCRLSL